MMSIEIEIDLFSIADLFSFSLRRKKIVRSAEFDILLLSSKREIDRSVGVDVLFQRADTIHSNGVISSSLFLKTIRFDQSTKQCSCISMCEDVFILKHKGLLLQFSSQIFQRVFYCGGSFNTRGLLL